MDSGTLTDLIYEAAFVPERWGATLDGLSATVGAVGATVFTSDLNQVLRWTSSDSIRQVLVDWVGQDWLSKNQRTHRLVRTQYAGFLTELDLFEPAELKADPEYAEFLKPRGIGGVSAGTFIPMPNGDVVIYSIERGWDQPPLTAAQFDRLNALRPHLARAGAVAARLGLDRARTGVEAFAAIGLPAAALGASGALLVANDLFQDLVPRCFQDSRARLTLQDRRADRLLEHSITAGVAAVAQAVCSIPLAANGEDPPFIVHLLPVTRAAHDVFSRVQWMVITVPVKPSAVPGAQVLQGLFDLTPAEARVARAVAEANSLDQLATTFGLSRATVRNQLKAVFSKTGVGRQAELAALLAGLQLPR